MIRAALVALCLLAPPATAQGVAAEAEAASAALREAIDGLASAKSARDRVAALTRTVTAYETGLAALREALRQARLRETQLAMRLEAESTRIGQLLGVLVQIEAQPAPQLLLHPSGPLGTARSGMLLAEVSAGLQAEAARLGDELAELRDLRAVQTAAADTLAGGLAAAQDARLSLSQAMSDRTPLPPRFAEAAEEMRQLAASVDTLEGFASALGPGPADDRIAQGGDFAAARGHLPLPVLGRILRRADEADAAGVRRPGVALATRPRALVTAPFAGTIRYRGPLLDYGNVMIFEPGGGYLVVLAGLGTVFGEVGEVVAAGAPLGMMGGGEPALEDFLITAPDSAAVRDTETLYMELRRGTRPENPAPWFAALGD